MKLDFVAICCVELKHQAKNVGAKLNSATVTKIFVAIRLSFLRRKISSLYITYSDEYKSLLKIKTYISVYYQQRIPVRR